MDRVTFSGGAAQLGLHSHGESGGFVSVPGPLFKVGDYPDKGFSLSTAEADAAVAAFAGAEMNAEHDENGFHGQVLKGAWGKIEKIWREGEQVMAQYKVPSWLAGLVKEKSVPLKTSAEWDKNTKQLVGAAWTLKPYLPGNEIVAAFSGSGDPSPATAKAYMKSQGMHRAKEFKGGSFMKDGNHVRATFSEGTADFTEGAAGVPKEHDELLKDGWSHSNWPGTGVHHYKKFDPETGHHSVIYDAAGHGTGKEKAWLQGPHETKHAPWVYYGDHSVVKPGGNFVPVSGGSAHEVLSAAQAKSGKTKFSAATPEMQELAALRAKDLDRQANDWAGRCIEQRKAVPAERGWMVALFKQAQADDKASGGNVVCFTDASEPVSRLDALKRSYELRLPHNLESELLDPKTQPDVLRRIVAKFSDTVSNIATTEGMGGRDETKLPGDWEQRRKEYLKLTPSGRAILEDEGRLA